VLGDRLSLPIRVVRLDDAKQLSEALKDVACVVHMAGPFAATSAPMLNACLATRTDYVCRFCPRTQFSSRLPKFESGRAAYEASSAVTAAKRGGT
jgi:saccharopine dehydrogenase-like NADP-dependent oxidoreductase